MASKKKIKSGAKLLNMVYGIGAALVILGALFKIMHWPFANEFLILGMGTEVLIFFISAFDFSSIGGDYEWEKVYPVLAEGNGHVEPATIDTSWTQSLDQLDGKVFGALSNTLEGLNNNVSRLSGVADAAGATNDYAMKIKEAAGKIDNLNRSYSVAVDSMSGFANAASDARAYHEQVQKITSNLSSLNSIYELELQDAKTHLKSLNQFYASMTQAMQNMSEASKDAEAYKQGMADLNKNLGRLNRVYGNMLSAMSGGLQ